VRAALVLSTLLLVSVAPLASATTTTTKQCTLGRDALVSVGTCAVSGYADAGIRVTIVAYDTTIGDVHVDLSNAAATPDSIEFECPLVGTSHSCVREIDTGGPDAGTWTVTGVYAGTDPLGAPAWMSVDFLTR
jgi:hypothetical protein